MVGRKTHTIEKITLTKPDSFCLLPQNANITYDPIKSDSCIKLNVFECLFLDKCTFLFTSYLKNVYFLLNAIFDSCQPTVT